MAISIEDAVRFYKDTSTIFCDAGKAGMRLMLLEIYGITYEKFYEYLSK